MINHRVIYLLLLVPNASEEKTVEVIYSFHMFNNVGNIIPGPVEAE